MHITNNETCLKKFLFILFFFKYTRINGSLHGSLYGRNAYN